MHDAQRAGMFHLGAAGGLAFSGRLPGINSEALFDDISDAAEKQDLDQVGQILRTVVASLRSDPPAGRPVSRQGRSRLGGRVSTDACRVERGAHGAGRG